MAITLLAGCGKSNHTHEWGEATYTWATDYSTCTALRVCKGDKSHKEEETVNSVYEVTTSATCEVDGEGKYTVTFTNTAFEVQTKTIVLEATGHKWGTPTYTWSNDYSSCTATRVCENDPTHVETETATSAYTETLPPTCLEDGRAVYDVAFENEAFETQSHEITLPATEHSWGTPTYTWSNDNLSCTAERVCLNDPTHKESETVEANYSVPTEPTCETAGVGRYTTNAFKNAAFKVQTKDVAIPATEHSWGTPTYTWSNDYSSCTATRVCENDPNHVETETVDSAYNVITPATCEADGEGKYTATFKNKAFETQSHEITLPATEHSWGTPTYTWNADNSKCTAERVCLNDPTHKESETVNSVPSYNPEPTCTEGGLVTYTATFKNAAFVTQVQENVAVPAKGHKYKITYTWNDDHTQCTATAVCENDSSHTLEETKTATTGGVEGTNGTVKYGNLVKFDSEVFTDQVYALYELSPIGNGYSVKGVNSALKGAITIPSSFDHTSVTAIKREAFAYDNDITSVTIPSSVDEIGINAFLLCDNLESVTFESGSNLKTIDGNAFGNTKIQSISIPASVENIGELAFTECEELASVTFESGSNLKSIDGNAFFCCYALNNLTLPASLETIGREAFSGCTSLFELSIESGSKLESIGDYAFSDSGFGQISLPATLEYIGSHAFNGLGSVFYSGTIEQWNAIKKGEDWCGYSNPSCIYCSDGNIDF